jgi:hypothetical protein
MRGEISEAMLFDIGYADGLTPVLAVTEKMTSDGSKGGMTPGTAISFDQIVASEDKFQLATYKKNANRC